MDIWNYDPSSGAYLGPGKADPCPILEGDWLIPANATSVPPPQFNPESEKCLFANGGWEVSKRAPIAAAQISLETVRARKIAELRSAYHAEIMSGFTSNALGSDHRYPSDVAEQLNLNSAIAIASTVRGQEWAAQILCGDKAGAWSPRSHSAKQTLKVGIDFRRFLEDIQSAFVALSNQVEAADNEADIEALNWR